MTQNALRHSVVGGGRTAKHLHHYFQSKGMRVSIVPAGRSLAEAAPAITTAKTSDVVWICVSDRAIEEVLDRLPSGPTYLHVSGAHVSERAFAMHPLMTFGQTLYATGAYDPIAFVGDERTPDLSRLAPELDNPFYRVPSDDRAHYHALCAMAGGFSTLVWQKLFSEFESRWNIPAAAAHPFLKRMTAQLIDDPSRALTGPLARGDWATVERHLTALGDDPYASVYRAFTKTFERTPPEITS